MTSLDEALKEFRSRGRLSDRNTLLSDFCGVKYRTASEWPKRPPRGSDLNKLLVLLAYNGLELPDYKKLDPAVRYLATLLAFDVLKPEDILLLLNIVKLQDVWAVTQGKRVPYKIKKSEVTDGWLGSIYGPQLAEALDLARAKGWVSSVSPRQSPPETPQTKPEVQAPPVPTDGEIHLVLAASFIAALLPLLKQAHEDGPEAVAALRAKLPPETFFAVLDLLKGMASDRARKFFTGSKGTE